MEIDASNRLPEEVLFSIIKDKKGDVLNVSKKLVIIFGSAFFASEADAKETTGFVNNSLLDAISDLRNNMKESNGVELPVVRIIDTLDTKDIAPKEIALQVNDEIVWKKHAYGIDPSDVQEAICAQLASVK